jgi:hypothetical protein
MQFHHNWVDNLNDEGLFLDAKATSHLRVYQNVITRCLSVISFAGGQVGGPKYIYRNLIDLRQPTVDHRPTPTADVDVFRFGQLYKTGDKDVDGPLDLFQNTCFVFQQKSPSYLHYSDTSSPHPHRSFNNLFVAINPSPTFDHPITFLPSPSFPGPTDGNCYFRIGHTEADLFRFKKYTFPNEPNETKAGTFKDLEALRGDPNANPPIPPSKFFLQSKTQYPPGYEAKSLAEDPLFRQLGGDGTPPFNSDDLRLREASPARGKGIQLPAALRKLDPLAPAKGRPDIGCYAFDQPPLQVGVDGRRHFPGETFEDPT